MKAILGEKIGMSQMFDADGNAVGVTLVAVSPNTIVDVRTKERDGYSAVALGMGTRKEKHTAKPQREQFKNLGYFRYIREFRLAEEEKPPAQGEKIEVSIFAPGDRVKVSGISKSKGFQGVVKRHGFHGAPATHGTKHAHREPGSIGGGARAGGRVIKGMRMAGRMGGERISVRNILVAGIDKESNILALRGAVPGRVGTLLAIRGKS